MKSIALASDHAGFQLKENIRAFLEAEGITVKDYGTGSEEPCDYPDFAAPAARAVSEGESDRAILCCGSAAGMVIVANKFPGVRAVACEDESAVKLCRQHNDANVLALGGGRVDHEEAKKLVRLWLDTEFEGGRHARRLAKIAALENSTQTTA
ncbi:MAG: ribose 5-phosphate isomerase B [bacterium]|nr:ribose 5-phosphate isomerase B [bacterium]